MLRKYQDVSRGLAAKKLFAGRRETRNHSAPFMVANADGIFSLEQEDLAVANLTGGDILQHGINELLNAFVCHHCLEQKLRTRLILYSRPR